MESNRLNLFSRKKGIVKQGLGHLFITLSTSLFFNKTDLELYRSVFLLPFWLIRKCPKFLKIIKLKGVKWQLYGLNFVPIQY